MTEKTLLNLALAHFEAKAENARLRAEIAASKGALHEAALADVAATTWERAIRHLQKLSSDAG